MSPRIVFIIMIKYINEILGITKYFRGVIKINKIILIIKYTY